MKFFFSRLCCCFSPPEPDINENSDSEIAYPYREMHQLSTSYQGHSWDPYTINLYSINSKVWGPEFKFFIHITRPRHDGESETATEDTARLEQGRKFHVSINHLSQDTGQLDLLDPEALFEVNQDQGKWDLANLHQGCDKVNAILKKHQVFHWKIMREDTLLKAVSRDACGEVNNIEVGKIITIYAFKEDPNKRDWSPIIEEINHSLSESGVRAGMTPFADRLNIREESVGDSAYVFERDDSKDKNSQRTLVLE